MEFQPATNKNSLAHFWPWLIVLLVLLFISFIRFRLLDMPLERDEGEYAYAGQLMLQGIPPYELAYNMKLPGTYLAYALGMVMFGQTAAGIHLMLIAVNSLTIIFVFLFARKLFGVVAGLVACASYGILSVSPAVMGMAAHANHFVVLFAVPATLLLWRAGESGRLITLFFSGLLYGLAFVMKQQGICFYLFGIFFLLWQAREQKIIFTTSFLKKCVWFGLGMILPFAAVCLWLAIAGVFAKFWFWTFTYASTYATGTTLREGAWKLGIYFQKKIVIYAGLLVLTAAGFLAARRDKSKAGPIRFVLGLLIFSFIGTATGLYFREHYFILMLPAFAVVVGFAVHSLQENVKLSGSEKIARAIPLVLFATILGWNIFYQRQLFFQLPANSVCQIIYGLDSFVETPAIANYIREHSAADARVAVIGSEPEIYFYARRHSATGYIYTYALMEPQPYALKMQQDMISEIESNKPEYLVWIGDGNSWNVRPTSNPAIFDWFTHYSKEFYEPVGVLPRRGPGGNDFLWDDAAKNYHGAVEPDLTVYKRKG
jgi:hypothetical protein